MMTPTFTSGKLKTMLEPIESIADDTLDHIMHLLKGKSELDLKPIIQGFTLDSISKVGFGIDTNVRRGEDSEFSKIAYDVFQTFSADKWINVIFFLVFTHFPEMLAYMNVWPESASKIRQMTHDLIVDRENKNINIGDFIDR